MSRELEEIGALHEAEDRAVGCLWKLPKDLAASVALHVAKELLARWEQEKLEMIRRRDPRKVYDFYRKDYAWLDTVLASASPSDPLLEQRVIGLLTHLPPDRPLFRGPRRGTGMILSLSSSIPAQ
jgi:hypothetical protein